jgi:hypothetical protein
MEALEAPRVKIGSFGSSDFSRLFPELPRKIKQEKQGEGYAVAS